MTNTDGLDAATLRAVAHTLDKEPDVDAVYSIGGGNLAIVEAFAKQEEPQRRSSPTISTMTTEPCCAADSSPQYCITTSAPTPSPPAE